MVCPLAMSLAQIITRKQAQLYHHCQHVSNEGLHQIAESLRLYQLNAIHLLTFHYD